MKKIKVIDLLNMIANGEEVPEKIRMNNYEFTYDKEKKEYYMEVGILNIRLLSVVADCNNLNDEVEIIEDKPTNEIEKLNLDTDELLKNVIITAQDYVIEGKINEIIDILNELKNKED